MHNHQSRASPLVSSTVIGLKLQHSRTSSLFLREMDKVSANMMTRSRHSQTFFRRQETCERKTDEMNPQSAFLDLSLAARGLLCDQPEILTKIELFDQLPGKSSRFVDRRTVAFRCTESLELPRRCNKDLVIGCHNRNTETTG